MGRQPEAALRKDTDTYRYTLLRGVCSLALKPGGLCPPGLSANHT